MPYQANASTLTRCSFLSAFLFKHVHKLIIFGTHNLQTFSHNKLLDECIFYLFNIRPKLHHRK